jgi:aminoglycoside phosphotransferase (APT) family kinase protein
MGGGAVVDGIDTAQVTAWIRERTELSEPLRFDLIEGGRSNLTYRVTDPDGHRVILRRPPLHGVLESAHDMGREHRIISALEGTDVPVPACVGFEPDTEVTGAPFYVMRFVDGEVVRDRRAAEDLLTPDARRAASEDLVDVLVRLHAVDVDEIGLGELSRREGYLDRQLRRWHGQLEKTRTRDLSLLDEIHRRLSASVPPQGPATIVHGDYRLDNVMLDPATGAVKAVLDWELTTLGDPLADVGLLLVYWTEPDDEVQVLPTAPTQAPGFAQRADLIEQYAAASGRDLGGIGYHVAFGYWKLACILEGVYSRYASGAYGETDGSFEAYGDLVVRLGESARDAATEAGL